MTALHLACGCWTSSSVAGIEIDRADLRRSTGICRLHGRQTLDVRDDLLQPILSEIVEPSTSTYERWAHYLP